MHPNEATVNHYDNIYYFKYHIKEILGMVRLIQDSCIEDIDRFDDDMSVIMRHIRHNAVTLYNEELCCIDDFKDGLNALKREQFVSALEIDMLRRFFISVGLTEDDTHRMGLH